MHLDSVDRDAYMFLRSEWSRAGWWSKGEKSMLLALDILRRQDYRLNIARCCTSPGIVRTDS